VLDFTNDSYYNRNEGTSPQTVDRKPDAIFLQEVPEIKETKPSALGFVSYSLAAQCSSYRLSDLRLDRYKEEAMAILEHKKPVIDTERFSIVSPVPPFVDICLKLVNITPRDFKRIAERANALPNDARLIEMVRNAGDASAKVPYLLDERETPDSILATLREIAQPQAERLQALPDRLRDTINLLLSIHEVPRGSDAYVISALLEMDRVQDEMIDALHSLMPGRHLARDFYSDNVTALRRLDEDWPRLRSETYGRWHNQPLPEKPQMQYHPLYDNRNRMVSLHETCVILESPDGHILKQFTPPILQRPLPLSVPETGSPDWLIRSVGKIGRHFTRALLTIIKNHLKAEQVALEAGNYYQIYIHAQEALQEFVRGRP
jgi:hypothetical protein